ncbi:hypothetical protein ACH5RR_024644 [Cinchona calisaya]|uniref:Uncharacterized protein n=1 Tax=Cinchona calisaya TaxID=153742 RepID=A0ABD2Z0H6_9GENT
MSSSNTGKSLELRVLNTNHACEMSSDTSTRKRDYRNKMEINNRLIKLLDERLRILEEEDEILKEEFTRRMKGRSELLNDVLKQFQVIEPIKKHMRTGLKQVLFRESNPSLVTRSSSARAGAIQDPATYRGSSLA